MQKAIFSLLILLTFNISLYAISAPKDIVGYWFVHKNNEHGHLPVVKIFEQNGKYYALGFAYKDLIGFDIKDKYNPDPKLQKRYLSTVMLIDAIKFKDGEWVDGGVYSPDNGNYYYIKGKISEDKNSITWRVSLDKRGFFGQSIVWNKANDTKQYEPYDPPMSKTLSFIPTEPYTEK